MKSHFTFIVISSIVKNIHQCSFNEAENTTSDKLYAAEPYVYIHGYLCDCDYMWAHVGTIVIMLCVGACVCFLTLSHAHIYYCVSSLEDVQCLRLSVSPARCSLHDATLQPQRDSGTLPELLSLLFFTFLSHSLSDPVSVRLFFREDAS